MSETIPLSQLRDEIRQGDEATLRRAKEHAANNSAQEVGPLRGRIDRLETTVNGEVGNDQKPGLALRVRDLEKTMQITLPNALDNLTDEIRLLTQGGRTPKGTPVVSADSERPPRKKPLIDSDTFKLILFAVLALTGSGGATAVVQAMRDTPLPMAQDAELERRERAIEAKERELRARSAGTVP